VGAGDLLVYCKSMFINVCPSCIPRHVATVPPHHNTRCFQTLTAYCPLYIYPDQIFNIHGQVTAESALAPKTYEEQVNCMIRLASIVPNVCYQVLTGFEVSWSTLALEITRVYNTMYST